MKSRDNPFELTVFNRLNVCVFLSVKYCQFIVEVGGANLTPIRRTIKQKPAEFQRVDFVYLGSEMKLNPLSLFVLYTIIILCDMVSHGV